MTVFKFSDGPIESRDVGDLSIDVYHEKEGYGFVISRGTTFLESKWTILTLAKCWELALVDAERFSGV